MPEPTPLTRDLASAAKAGVLAVVFGGFGAGALANEHPIAGLVFGGLGVAFAWGAAQARRGACPTCGAPIPADGKAKRCAKCDAYAFIEKDRLVPVPQDFIASSPWLTMSVLQLRGSARDWKWPWPERCAACGRAATRQLPLRVKLLTGVVGPMAQVTTSELGIPHCAEHTDGVGFSDSAAEPMLGFRSYAHYWDFLNANRRPR
jgi:hypothetical protein